MQKRLRRILVTISAAAAVSFAGTAHASNPLNISNAVISGQTSTTLTFTFATDNPGSTQLSYGINDTYGSTTVETDTSPRVTSHTATITGLQPCTVYSVEAISRDANAFQATAGFGGDVSTLGCLANQQPILADTFLVRPGDAAGDESASSITNSHSNASIDVATPASLVTQNTTFQIKGYDSSAMASTIGVPSGYRVLHDTVFQLTALTDSLVPVTSFTQPLTVRLVYNSTDFTTIDPASITIQQWEENTQTWSGLTGCVTTSYNNNSQPDPNGTIKDIACQTNHFSVFALTGKTQQAAATTTATPMPSSTATATSTTKPITTLPVTGTDYRLSLLMVLLSLSLLATTYRLARK